MKRYSKMFIGLALIVGTWLAGFLLWQFLGENVRMNNSIREMATLFIGISFIPSVLMYIIWYFSYLKAQTLVNARMPKGALFGVFGSVLTAVLLIVPMLIFGFDKAILYIVIALALMIIGSFLAYKVGEPQ